MRRSSIFAVVACLMPTTSLVAQDLPLVSATIAAPDTLFIGTPIQFDITVSHATGDRVALPDSLDLAPFEILDVSVGQPSQERRDETVATLHITAFEVGDLTLPPVSIVVGHSDGTVDTLFTDPVPISIESVGLDPSGDIRDIKPPLSIARNWLLLLPFVAALGALIALALWYYRRRRSNAPQQPVPAEPVVSPHEKAYRALDRLDRSDLLPRGLIKDYHIALSDIVRTYLLGRWGIDAVDMTSGEALELLARQDDAASTDIDRCTDVLARCDMVKFAKHKPSVSESRELIPLSRQFVDATRRRESPAANEAA